MACVHFMDVHLGISKSPSNSLDQSLELLQKSIDLDENDSRAYSLLCHVYAIKRQFEKSIAAGQKAIEMNPNSDHALVNLAIALNWVGKSEEAITLHQRAIRLCPFPPSFYYLQLGNAYRTADRCEEAIVEYKKAQHLTPTNIFVFASYGTFVQNVHGETFAQLPRFNILQRSEGNSQPLTGGRRAFLFCHRPTRTYTDKHFFHRTDMNFICSAETKIHQCSMKTVILLRRLNTSASSFPRACPGVVLGRGRDTQ